MPCDGVTLEKTTEKTNFRLRSVEYVSRDVEQFKDAFAKLKAVSSSSLYQRGALETTHFPSYPQTQYALSLPSERNMIRPSC